MWGVLTFSPPSPNSLSFHPELILNLLGAASSMSIPRFVCNGRKLKSGTETHSCSLRTGYRWNMHFSTVDLSDLARPYLTSPLLLREGDDGTGWRWWWMPSDFVWGGNYFIPPVTNYPLSVPSSLPCTDEVSDKTGVDYRTWCLPPHSGHSDVLQPWRRSSHDFKCPDTGSLATGQLTTELPHFLLWKQKMTLF